MKLNQLTEILPKEFIKQNEPMKNHTSFRIGGNADLFVLPQTIDELNEIIKLCKKTNTPFFVMGNGTNLLVDDKGIRGVVIKTTNINHININGRRITAGSGVLLCRLAIEALKLSLSGLEFAHGIPGTLGGAVVMNAGAYGGEMKDIIVSTKYLDENNEIKQLSDHNFGYRKSIFMEHPDWIVLESTLLLKKDCKENIKSKMDEYSLARKTKQPLNVPSAGSVFKRPQGYYAGKLIQDCGLRGYKVGGAQVSEKHCGFIVNNGNATSEDVLQLIEDIKNKVKIKFGVKLQTEIKYVGGK